MGDFRGAADRQLNIHKYQRKKSSNDHVRCLFYFVCDETGDVSYHAEKPVDVHVAYSIPSTRIPIFSR